MPWCLSMRSRAASAASLVRIIPPSPVVTTLRACRLKIVIGAMPLAAEAAANGAGGILNDQQAARLCKLKDPIDLARHAELVDRQDDLGAGTDLACHILRVEVESARVDVDEHGGGTGVNDDIDGRDKGERGHDHLVTRPDA
jgi:hypothetical protein